jgi:hypothetical protein
MEITVGRTYRAKKPAATRSGYVNDRQVVYVGELNGQIQYDGPAIPIGGRMKWASKAEFEAWAARDVTDEQPNNEWTLWERGIK